jgi:hypothetical protein
MTSLAQSKCIVIGKKSKICYSNKQQKIIARNGTNTPKVITVNTPETSAASCACKSNRILKLSVCVSSFPRMFLIFCTVSFCTSYLYFNWSWELKCNRTGK